MSRWTVYGLEALLDSLGVSTSSVGFVIKNKAACRAQRGKSRSKLSQAPLSPGTSWATVHRNRVDVDRGSWREVCCISLRWRGFVQRIHVHRVEMTCRIKAAGVWTEEAECRAGFAHLLIIFEPVAVHGQSKLSNPFARGRGACPPPNDYTFVSPPYSSFSRSSSCLCAS